MNILTKVNFNCRYYWIFVCISYW